jgi:tetratricopeptide (TPR) repeat protein
LCLGEVLLIFVIMFLLPESPKPIKIFFAYSPSSQDEQLRQVLEKHLRQLEDLDVVMVWYQHYYTDENKSLEFDNSYHLQTADVIVLLVSSDFLALIQNRIDWSHEIAKLQEKHLLGEVVALPILLYQVQGWQKLLGNIAPLPKNGMPVKSWQNLDAALVDISQGIEATVGEIQKYQQRLQEYRYSYGAAIVQEYPLRTKALNSLNDIKNYLGIKNQDADLVQQEVTSQAQREYKQKLQQYKKELDYFSRSKKLITEKDRQKLHALQEFLCLQPDDIAQFEQPIPGKVLKFRFLTNNYKCAVSAALIGLVVLSVATVIIYIRSTAKPVEKLLTQAQIKFEQGNYKKSVEMYTQAIKLDPENIHGYIGRGNARSYLKDYQGAIADYTFVINMSSTAPIAYMNRAVVNCTLGSQQNAIKDYQRAAHIYKQLGANKESDLAVERLNNLQICLPKVKQNT